MNARVLLIVLLGFGSGPVLAADWAFEPRLSASAVYNDNYRMAEASVNQNEVSGAELDLQLTMRAETPRSQLLLTPRLRSSFYPGDAPEESNDKFVLLRTRHGTERMQATLDADFSRVATRGTYFPGADVGDDVALGDADRSVEVGRTGLFNREDRIIVAPGVSFELSERRMIELSAAYVDVAYDIRVPGDREDYVFTSAVAGFKQHLTPTSSFLLRAGYSRFDPDGGESRDGQGVTAEWRNQISETSEVYVRGGASRVESEAVSGEDSRWDTGFTGGAGIRWAFEITELWLDAGRSFSPTSSGDVVTRDDLRLQLRRRLTALTRVTLGARMVRDSATDASPERGDQTYATGRVGFDWRLARQWTFFASYDYKWRKYDGAENDAEANAVRLGLTYEPKRR